MTRLSPPVILGEVELPSGVLIILDPGLARFWRHSGDPRSPRRGDPEEVDMAFVGTDAPAAGRAYDRQFDPRFLYDVSDAAAAQAHFAQFAREHRFDARLQVLPCRVPHTERAIKAIGVGGGLGVAQYHGLWAVAVAGLPAGRPLPVCGTLMPPGEFAGRWRRIEVIAHADAEVARSDSVQGVMVEHGQMLCAGLEPLGEFRMWESLDGLADYVFWGADAPALAAEMGAVLLGDEGVFGWRNLPMSEVGGYAQPVQERIERNRLRVAVDYRPHCNLERLNAQIRTTPLEAGTLTLAGCKACGFSNRWGDGIFAVSRHFDAEGRVVRVTIDLGTEERQALMRAAADVAGRTDRASTG